jgi:hypothetical protein
LSSIGFASIIGASITCVLAIRKNAVGEHCVLLVISTAHELMTAVLANRSATIIEKKTTPTSLGWGAEE